jgi:exopolyphosphatase/guanosine-5'-triphosphate,3'-diphosphate pyrophosphatase
MKLRRLREARPGSSPAGPPRAVAYLRGATVVPPRDGNPGLPSGGPGPKRPFKGGDNHRRKERRQFRRRGGRYDHVFAALDLGTNNCRLLIARPDGEGFRVLDAFSRVVRLGEGVDQTNRLSDQAMDRAIDALHICAEKMTRRQVTRARAIATEACRRAENGAEFVARVRRETGLSLDVIGAGEEARLAVAGCAPLFDSRRECLLVFDIGGGSTELVWIDLHDMPRSRRRDILLGVQTEGIDPATLELDIQTLARNAHWTSLPVGVVTLAERFKTVSDERERFDAMRAHTMSLIAPFAATGAGATEDRLTRMQLLGTSGTITTLAGVYLDLPRYNRSMVDGVWLERLALSSLIDNLLSMTREERSTIPCIGDDRSELVISGASILSAILHYWPTEQLRVADRGLREGLLYGLMNREDAIQRANPRDLT